MTLSTTSPFVRLVVSVVAVMAVATATASSASAADSDDEWMLCPNVSGTRSMAPLAPSGEVSPGTVLVAFPPLPREITTPDGGRFYTGEAILLIDGHQYQNAKFTVRKRHLGQQIVQVVILRELPPEGRTLPCPPIFGYTPPVVVKAIGTATAKPAASSVSTDTRLEVSVKVKADGVPKPAGKIRVAVDGTHALTKTLDPSAKGSIQIKLPQLAKGRHTVTVSYVDATGKVQDATAKPFTVRAR
ncbi:MAG: Ig-like domain-containing protein [Bifidobacteriaceae bacterium]|jgi:hypothetical protein|nr:Ig-like domain-containing protein [Bifidobacteriaceae bacterium]